MNEVIHLRLRRRPPAAAAAVGAAGAAGAGAATADAAASFEENNDPKIPDDLGEVAGSCDCGGFPRTRGVWPSGMDGGEGKDTLDWYCLPNGHQLDVVDWGCFSSSLSNGQIPPRLLLVLLCLVGLDRDRDLHLDLRDLDL